MVLFFLALMKLYVIAALIQMLVMAESKVEEILSTDEFETKVIDAEHVALIGFIYDSSKFKKCDEFIEWFNTLGEHPDISGSFYNGILNIKNSKEIATEFNVRKRSAPQLHLFHIRSRSSVKLDIMSDDDEDGTAFLPMEAILPLIKSNTAENEKSKDDGFYNKIVLQLGANGVEL